MAASCRYQTSLLSDVHSNNKFNSLKPIIKSIVSNSQLLKIPSTPMSTRFNFDTYKLVRQLERQGFTRSQSVALMRTINAFLVDSTLSLRAELITETELENETYLSKAHLQDLRNELSSLRQNDSLALKSESESIQREIESIDQKLAEHLLSLKTNISMDLNNHKAESKELSTEVDLQIQEIHHKLIIRLSDMKTNIETMKVELTQTIVYMIVTAIAGIMMVDWFLKPDPEVEQLSIPTLPYGFYSKK
ncbi:hypothetical protein BC833DRAFT_620026 [Globomyces pollinis-pini]|nr:hypothetical protein BC833DRAFT_620026 [Globomyces pollinis-pini]